MLRLVAEQTVTLKAEMHGAAGIVAEPDLVAIAQLFVKQGGIVLCDHRSHLFCRLHSRASRTPDGHQLQAAQYNSPKGMHGKEYNRYTLQYCVVSDDAQADDLSHWI